MAALVSGRLLAAAAGSAGAPAGGEPLDDFVRQLGGEQKTRVAPIVQAARTNALVRQNAVLEVLLALNPDFVKALRLLNDENPAEALKMLDRLVGASDPFLAAHAAWFRIQGLIGLERYEDALSALPAVQTNAMRYTQVAGEMLYTKGLLQAYLLERPAAAVTLRLYLETFPQAPPSLRGAAQGILDEIERAKPISLPEVATLMNESRRRLKLNDGGDLTQTRQGQIVQTLDAIIKELEKKNGGGGGGGGGSSSGSGSGQGGTSGGKGGGAKESALAGGASGTALDHVADSGNPDAWAKAYARDREAVQRELQTKMPERYRALIEQYYRSLSTDGKTGEK
ncbi:MAG: hypothetical protein ACOYOU_07615 [Kiritimatiellia bacterium]